MLRRNLISIALTSTALIWATACAPIPVAQSKPAVIIVAPPSGSQYAEGDDVAVQSTATDPTGVVRVELTVDGASVSTDSPPTAQGQPSFSVIQHWKAAPGSHTLVVRAANAAGVLSDPAGIVVSVLPATTPTASAGQTTVPSATAVRTATATSTVAPPTAAVGSVSGQVTVKLNDDLEKPAANTHVEILGLPSVATVTDNNGNYNLNQVPFGSQYIFAKNQFGESNPLQVVVAGGGTKNVNVRLLQDAGGGAERIYTGRVTRNGQPVQGATVWTIGDVAVTSTNREGRYWLVHWVRQDVDGVRTQRDPFFIVASDGSHWNGVYRPEDPDKPTPDIDLIRPAPPTPPQVIQDLVDDAEGAAWSSTSGALTFNGNANDPKGSVRYRSNIVLEDKSSPDRVLETYPPRVAGGFIAGLLSRTVTFQKTDFAYGIVAFPDQANNADVSFRLRFVPNVGAPQDLLDFSKDYDGQLTPFAASLEDFAGKPGKIELRAFIGNQIATAGRAVWVEANIGRGN
ncbi:MAG TPA: Ig-like domain-containing protein [Anaerolineae bacterium]